METFAMILTIIGAASLTKAFMRVLDKLEGCR